MLGLPGQASRRSRPEGLVRAAARTTAPGTILCSSGSDGVSAGQPCRLPSDDLGSEELPCQLSSSCTPIIDGRDGLPCQRLLPSPPRPPPPPPPSHQGQLAAHPQGSPTASGPVSCTSRCRRRACGRWYGRSLERRPIVLSATGHRLPSLAKSARLADSTVARKEESPRSPAGRAENPLLQQRPARPMRPSASRAQTSTSQRS